MNDTRLIAYYSRSGNTRRIAKIIHQILGGTLHEILPEIPYPASYHQTLDRAKREIRSDIKPPLQSTLEQIETFNPIFIGSPNWWSTIAPPVASFLTQFDLSGKTIIPFCTHGGGGLNNIAKDIAKLCPRSNLLNSFVVYGSGRGNVRADAESWLNEIGIKDQDGNFVFN